MLSLAVPRWKRATQDGKATTQRPSRQRGLTQVSPAGNPKRSDHTDARQQGRLLKQRREGRVTATPRRPEAVGWAPLRDGRPAGYLPSGTVGQWSPVTGQWWTRQEGGDPRTNHVTKGADSELPGWQPEEKATQLPRKEVISNQAWVLQKREGPKDPRVRRGGDPRTLASRRHWLPQVVAATAGAIRVDGRMRRPVRLLRRTPGQARRGHFHRSRVPQRAACGTPSS